MKSAIIFAMMVMCANAHSAWAQETVDNVFGEGVYRCSAWTEARSSFARNMQTLENQRTLDARCYKQWVLGYMTAAMRGVERSKLGHEDVLIWIMIDRYCAAHPDRSIADAAAEVTKESLQ
jgi:hypothetical protein